MSYPPSPGSLPPTPPAQAAHRHVRPLGLLAVLWTDRQLSSPLCLDLEELLEAHLPGGCSCLGSRAFGLLLSPRAPSTVVPRLIRPALGFTMLPTSR